MAELTPEANRAARAILKWSVRDLAENAGIAFSTVHRFETTGAATKATKEKIKAAYAAHNVEITNGDHTGARLKLHTPRDWTPMIDEDGEPVPLIYSLGATNFLEEPVGIEIDSEEAEPATYQMLFDEAKILAMEVANDYPDEKPWRGWLINVTATGLHSEPEQICKFTFEELLPARRLNGRPRK